MNVWFVGIMMVLGVVAALIFAIGVLFIGMSAIVAAYGCIMDDPEYRFVVGIDFGKQYLDALDRIVDSTETIVELNKNVIDAYTPEEEGDKETIDF